MSRNPGLIYNPATKMLITAAENTLTAKQQQGQNQEVARGPLHLNFLASTIWSPSNSFGTHPETATPPQRLQHLNLLWLAPEQTGAGKFMRAVGHWLSPPARRTCLPHQKQDRWRPASSTHLSHDQDCIGIKWDRNRLSSTTASKNPDWGKRTMCWLRYKEDWQQLRRCAA